MNARAQAHRLRKQQQAKFVSQLPPGVQKKILNTLTAIAIWTMPRKENNGDQGRT